MFTDKPISLQAFNDTSAFFSILISSPIKFTSHFKILVDNIPNVIEQITTNLVINICCYKIFQVNKSTQKTIEDIEYRFDLLISVLLEVLEKRRAALKSQALKIKEEGLTPLHACHDLISGKLKSTQLYIEEGRNILRVGGLTSPEEALKFSEQASKLGR